MIFTKNPNSDFFFFFLGGGGGGSVEGGGIGVRRMGAGGGECKITNLSHHRIHVHNIVFVTIYISKEKDH